MSTPILTAVADPAAEARLVTALGEHDHGVTVVRRCVDLADLLAAATTGSARAAVVSADLRDLDRDALARLAAARVGVVVLVATHDGAAERRVRQLGVETVLPASAAPAQVAVAIDRAAAAAAGRGAGDASRFGYGDPVGSRPGLAVPDPDELESLLGPGAGGPDPGPAGRVIAVWGPAGAPGRSTVAAGLAAELAAPSSPVLLVDADTYGGCLAQLLGVVDEGAGLAGALRAANQGTLDVPRLASFARDLGDGLRLLPGIARPGRWPEIRPASLEVLLALARRLAPWTVVDCGFCLEQDEELSFDTAAPQRNGATLATVATADQVLAVAAADPIGLARFVRGLGDLREAVPAVTPSIVANRVRGSVTRGDAAHEVAATLARHAGGHPVASIPLDVAAVDRAHLAGRTLREAAPDAPARRALAALAAELAGRPAGVRRRWQVRA